MYSPIVFEIIFICPRRCRVGKCQPNSPAQNVVLLARIACGDENDVVGSANRSTRPSNSLQKDVLFSFVSQLLRRWSPL